MLAGLLATAGAFLIPRSVIQAAPASDDDFTFFPLVGSRAGELRCVPHGRRRQQYQQETAAPSDWDGRQIQCPRQLLWRDTARAPTPGGYLMHTPSTRILSALAYDRGEEYDPGQPLVPGAGRGAVAGRARRAGDRRRRPVRAGAPAPARAPRAAGDPRLVLGRGPDRGAVGDDGRAVPLIDRAAARARHRRWRARAGHRFKTTTSKEVTCQRPLRPSCWPRSTTPRARSSPTT